MSDPQNLDFSLPNDQWIEISPPAGTAFQAMRRGEFDEFRPNIAVYLAQLNPGATLEDVANDAAGRIAAVDPEAVVNSRQIVEGDSAYVMQALTFHIDIRDIHVDLAQWQTIVELATTDDERWTMAFTLTAAASEIATYGADYQAFIASARPVDAAS